MFVNNNNNNEELKEFYEYYPSQVLNMQKYFKLSIFAFISLYLFFNSNSLIDNLNFTALEDFKQAFTYFFLSFAIYCFLKIIYLYFTLKSTKYIIEPFNAIISIHRGIFSKEIDTIKISKIQDIDISISFKERIFSLGTLAIYTSGDMSAINDELTKSEKNRLNKINNNVAVNYMSIRKMFFISKPKSAMKLLNKIHDGL